MNFTQAITITFGDVAENHIGNQKLGNMVQNGFSIEELKNIQSLIPKDYMTELINLSSNVFVPKNIKVDDASVLIIRNGVNYLLNGIKKTSDDVYKEHSKLITDKKYYDTRRGKVLNKNARHNLCFADYSQVADYENGKGTIVSFNDLECTHKIREELGKLCGIKGTNLMAEGNYYYDPNKTGIGFHGDAERRIVIALRLGVSIPLHYQWYYQSKSFGERIKLNLNHGDIYIMSEKATGYDWKKRSITTLRHAAGCDKYLKEDNPKKEKKTKSPSIIKSENKKEIVFHELKLYQPPLIDNGSNIKSFDNRKNNLI